MRKKILFLMPQDVSIPTNGAAVIGWNLINYFSKRNEIHVVYMANDTFPRILNDRVESTIRIKDSKLGYFLFSPAMYNSAQKLMKKIDFDVIFLNTINAGICGILLSRIFLKPMIYYSHNVEYMRHLDLAKRDLRRYFFIPIFYLLEKICCKKAFLTLAITENDKKILKKWSDNIIVAPGGFNAEVHHPFYKTNKNNAPIVLFFGNFDYLPNREAAYLIRDRILELVIREYPNLKFLIIGKNPPQDISHPNIDVKGAVRNIVEYIRRADVVINPVIRGGGIRMKIIESLACGKTVISTFKGASGIPHIFRNLKIGKLEEFPSLICETIRKENPVDSEDYTLLKNDYAFQNILLNLEKNIDLSLSGSNKNNQYRPSN